MLSVRRRAIVFRIEVKRWTLTGLPVAAGCTDRVDCCGEGDWGGGDLEDLHSTVDYLKTLPYVDADRIGIWGNSYGGMMVLFALFEKPGMFAAGVSGAPAIDVARFTGNDQLYLVPQNLADRAVERSERMVPKIMDDFLYRSQEK